MDLTELDRLARQWRDYADSHEEDGQRDRTDGYHAGLRVCADQLAETLQRFRADAEAAALVMGPDTAAKELIAYAPAAVGPVKMAEWIGRATAVLRELTRDA